MTRILLLVLVLAMPGLAMAEEARPETALLSKSAITLPAAPDTVRFQDAGRQRGDSLWNGMAIGAGIGAVVGMLVMPQALCGSNDTECATIVRVVIGLPSIAGGLGIGALVDGLHRDVRGAQFTVSF
jgi:hypothetical protein